MRILLVGVIALGMGVSLQAQQNNSDVMTNGPGISVSVDQPGSNNNSDLDAISGEGNFESVFSILQAGTYNSSIIFSTGFNNKGTIQQYNPYGSELGNNSNLYQNGDNNNGEVYQEGELNNSQIQQGDANTFMASNSTVRVGQVGVTLNSSVTQDGDGHTTEIQQGYTEQDIQVNQTGINHTVLSDQVGSGLNITEINQTGENHTAMSDQDGTDHENLVNQEANDNTAFIHQDGFSHNSNIYQPGINNGVQVVQRGDENDSQVEQPGSNNSSVVEQGADPNYIDPSGFNTSIVLQEGIGDFVEVRQDGTFNNSDVHQGLNSNNNMLTVVQQGDNHLSTVALDNLSDTQLNVNQYGSSQTSTINTLGGQSQVTVNQGAQP